MPDDQTVLYSLLGVALLLVAVIYYNNLRAKAEAATPADEERPSSDAYLLKFVRHDGNVVGETVAHEGDTLILKQAGVFKAVSVALAEVEGDEVVLRGDIDWDDAIAKGTAWHGSHTKGTDPMVSADLTRSEDVRKPALEALKDKEKEAAGSDGEGTAVGPGPAPEDEDAPGAPIGGDSEEEE